MKNNKVLVIGGAGFIGSHVVDVLLKQGSDVKIYDNLSKGRYRPTEAEVIVGDILDVSLLRKCVAEYNPNIVFHLAAHHFIPFCEKNPYDAFNVNVNGTLSVIDACMNSTSVEKLFFASTGDVYCPSNYKNREMDYVSPVYVYGETKLICENIFRRYLSSVNPSFCIVIGRLFNAAGTRETNPHLLPEVVRQIQSGVQTLELGNLWPLRDFVDVDSMARVIVNLTKTVNGSDVYNIGSGQVQSVQNAIELLIKASGSFVEYISIDSKKRPNDRPYLCPSVDKLRNSIGYACEPFSFESAQTVWSADLSERFMY